MSKNSSGQEWSRGEDYIKRKTYIDIFVGEHYLYSWDEIEEVMDAAQAEKVVPQRTGQWKDDGKGSVFCSECGAKHEKPFSFPNFCDNCGADMRGAVNE